MALGGGGGGGGMRGSSHTYQSFGIQKYHVIHYLPVPYNISPPPPPTVSATALRISEVSTKEGEKGNMETM